MQGQTRLLWNALYAVRLFSLIEWGVSEYLQVTITLCIINPSAKRQINSRIWSYLRDAARYLNNLPTQHRLSFDNFLVGIQNTAVYRNLPVPTTSAVGIWTVRFNCHDLYVYETGLLA